MAKVFLPAVTAAIIIILTAALLLSHRRSYLLTQEKEKLILQFDSLHILTIETRNQLQSMQHKMDSITGKDSGGPYTKR